MHKKYLKLKNGCNQNLNTHIFFYIVCLFLSIYYLCYVKLQCVIHLSLLVELEKTFYKSEAKQGYHTVQLRKKGIHKIDWQIVFGSLLQEIKLESPF